MEILFCEYRCENCGVGVETMRSVHLDVPCKLSVACPECKNEKLVLLSCTRMVSNEEDEEEEEEENENE
jgi:hypothetical protein